MAKKDLGREAILPRMIRGNKSALIPSNVRKEFTARKNMVASFGEVTQVGAARGGEAE